MEIIMQETADLYVMLYGFDKLENKLYNYQLMN